MSNLSDISGFVRRVDSAQLDPRRANVGFLLLGEPSGTSAGTYREYYWYDPEWKVPAVYDDELRELHPEISDEEWQELFSEASVRGERDFERVMDDISTEAIPASRPCLGGALSEAPVVSTSGRLPRLLDERRLAEELNITRAAALAIMRRLPKVNHPADLRKVYVREADVVALLEEATAS
jgi:hypothetical protein